MIAWLIQNPTKQEAYEVSMTNASLKKIGFKTKIITPNNIDLNEEIPNIVILRNTKNLDYDNLKILESLGCIMLNKVDQHYITSDKWKQYQKLNFSKLRIPKTILSEIPFNDNLIDIISEELSWPCIVKRRYGAFGIGVFICHNEDDLYSIAKIFLKTFNEKNMLLQEYIHYSGDYISVTCIGEKMWSHIAKPPCGDNTFLSYKKDGTIRKPYDIDSNLRDMINQSMKSLELDIARIDILFEKSGYVICEVNSPGGFRMTEEIHNKSISDEIALFAKNLIHHD